MLSAAMMLEWFEHEETIRGAKNLRAAISKVLADPNNRTPDMGGKMKTQQITKSVIDAMGS